MSFRTKSKICGFRSNKPVKVPKTGNRLFSNLSAKAHKHWFWKSATSGNRFRFLRILEILSKKGKESCSRISGAGSVTEAYLQPRNNFSSYYSESGFK